MFNLLPRDKKFYDQTEALADHLVHASGELESIFDHFPNLDSSLASIDRDRLGSKAVFQESLLGPDKTFITPIDREDTQRLSQRNNPGLHKILGSPQSHRRNSVPPDDFPCRTCATRAGLQQSDLCQQVKLRCANS
jgi:hypothetical protein